MNVTFYDKNDFADKSLRISKWRDNPGSSGCATIMWSLYKGRGGGVSQAEGSVTMEAEIGVMRLQAMECWVILEDGKDQDKDSLGTSRRNAAICTH